MSAAPASGLYVERGPRGKWRSLPDDDYYRLLVEQDGHCALCLSRPKTRRLHVDHDHKTGRVRGLLCHRCNRWLPNFVTVEWLYRALVYLLRHEERRREDIQVAATMALFHSNGGA